MIELVGMLIEELRKPSAAQLLEEAIHDTRLQLEDTGVTCKCCKSIAVATFTGQKTRRCVGCGVQFQAAYADFHIKHPDAKYVHEQAVKRIKNSSLNKK